MNDWIPFQQVNFDEIAVCHIDTRDFHCNTLTEHSDKIPSIHKLKNYPERFFFTKEEVIETVNDLFVRSGGKGQWRMLALIGNRDTISWEMKYLRIYKTEYGFIICNRDSSKAFKKDELKLPIDKEHLVHH